MSEKINSEYKSLYETLHSEGRLNFRDSFRMGQLRWQSTLQPWRLRPPVNILEYCPHLLDVTEGVLLWSEGKVDREIMLASCKDFLEASESWSKESQYPPGHPYHGKYHPHPIVLLQDITRLEETRRFLQKHIARVDQGDYPKAIEGRKEALYDFIQSKWRLWPRMINADFCEVSLKIEKSIDREEFNAVRSVIIEADPNPETGEPRYISLEATT